MVLEYVSSIKTAWEMAKVVKASTDAIDDAQIKLQMADLIASLSEVRIQATESEEKIAQLEKLLRVKDEFKFDGRVYYRVNGDSGEPDGPWCPTCFDARGNQIRLQTVGQQSQFWKCYECKGEFGQPSRTFAPRRST